MAPRKRFIAKVETDPTQRKITQYFAKSDKWKHDFTITIPKKKTPIRLLVPEIVATIDLNSSDDECHANNLRMTPPKSRNEKTTITKQRKRRIKRAKANLRVCPAESQENETNIDNTINCGDFVETQLEPDVLQNIIHDADDPRVSLISIQRESISDDLQLQDKVSGQSYGTPYVAQINPGMTASKSRDEKTKTKLRKSRITRVKANLCICPAESQENETNIDNTINCGDFIETQLDPDILQNIIHNADDPHVSLISIQRESVSVDLQLQDTVSGQLYETPYVAQINPDIPFRNGVHITKNFPLPQLYKISENTRYDSVRINKSKILINSPEKSKSIILQSNTADLFSVHDDIEASTCQTSDTIIPSLITVFNETVDINPQNGGGTDLYLERFGNCNKENSPEICNTLIPNEVPDCDNLLKSQPSSAPMNDGIDITIASFEPEESNAMDTTLIKDYINRNNNENIHDVLVELHNALDRMENTDAIDPDSPYYKMFFLRKVIRNVVENFDMLRLLRDVERRTLVKFLQMDTKYQYCCYRLFTRLPKWYNMYKLIDNIKLDMSKKDISDMYSCLQENNFIQTDYSKESISTLLHLMERNALSRIHKNFKIKRSKYTTKEGIIDSLISFCNSQTTLSANFRPDQVLYKLISVEMGPCAKLENNFYTTLSRVHLLNSFTNSELPKISDLYFFLSQIEKGDVVLPSYDVESAIGNIFPKRQDFLLYSKAAEYKNQFILKMEKAAKNRDWQSIKGICDCSYLELQIYIQNNTFQNTSDLMNRYTAGYKYASILSEASKHLTKMYTDDVEKWLHLLLMQRKFCQKRRGLWYDRLALIKSTYKKDVDLAADVVIKGLDDPFVSESGRREILNRGINFMKRKTCKVRDDLMSVLKLKIPKSLDKKYSVRNIQGKQQSGNQGKCYFLENDGEHHTYYTVEEYCIKHYTTELDFTDGVHCEGALFNTLFTLLFWDIIYDEYTAGTFLNNLQIYPLDYYSKDFYVNREYAVDGRLEQITRVWSEECFERTITHNFSQHSTKRCGIVSNFFQSGEQLVTIARCIGRESLAVVMKRMVMHLGDMCAGLPDLFVWNAVTNKCKFVEVKSAKDTLSMKQILWLNFLISANLDAEICHVLPSINTSNIPASKRATVE